MLGKGWTSKNNQRIDQEIMQSEMNLLKCDTSVFHELVERLFIEHEKDMRFIKARGMEMCAFAQGGPSKNLPTHLP